ncbi:MAG: DNA gyrase C-terminal beta-propeller domain-containing protein [Deltaproteobacteria bacterium]
MPRPAARQRRCLEQLRRDDGEVADAADHRREVVTRRSRFELKQAESQREIVLGLGMATTEIDLVIKTIRAAENPEIAREELMKLPLRGLEEFVRRAGRPDNEIAEAAKVTDYRLSERQAKAILDMRLARLTGLEREKLAGEYGELSTNIARLKAILASEGTLFDVIEHELREIREKYGEGRRTEIIPAEGEISIEDLIAQHDVVVTCSRAGYIKRTSLADYRSQNRRGKGVQGMDVREEDWVHQIFVASSHDTVMFLSDKGKAYTKKIYEIPEANRTSRGKAIVNFVGMEPGEKVAAVVPIKEFREGWDLVTCSLHGLIKRTDLTAYANIRQTGIIAVAIEEGDQLLAAVIADPKCEVLVGTRKGMSIRFPLEDVRQVGRDSRGVKAIELREGDAVVGMRVIDDDTQQVFAVCANGYGKRTVVSEHRAQGRGGSGVIAIDASERNGDVVDLVLVRDGEQVMAVTDKGQIIRTFVDQIRLAGRNTQGVRIIDVKEGEKVVAVERIQQVGGEGESEASSSVDPAAEAPPAQEPETPSGGEPSVG